MKRIKAVAFEKRGLRKWLKLSLAYRDSVCPFKKELGNHKITCDNTTRYCLKFFPKAKPSSIFRYFHCPCYSFSIKYVTKVAKELVK